MRKESLYDKVSVVVLLICRTVLLFISLVFGGIVIYSFISESWSMFLMVGSVVVTLMIALHGLDVLDKRKYIKNQKRIEKIRKRRKKKE